MRFKKHFFDFEYLEDRRLLAFSVLANPATFTFSASGQFEGSGPFEDTFRGSFFESGSITYSGGDETGLMKHGIGKATGNGSGNGSDICTSYRFSFSGGTNVIHSEDKLARGGAATPEPTFGYTSPRPLPNCWREVPRHPLQANVAGTLNSTNFMMEGKFSQSGTSGKITGSVQFTSAQTYDVGIVDAKWTGDDAFSFRFTVQGPPKTSTTFATPVSFIRFAWSDEKGDRRTAIEGLTAVPIYWNSVGGLVSVSGLPKTAMGQSHLTIIADPVDLNSANNLQTLQLVELKSIVATHDEEQDQMVFGTYLPGISLLNDFGVEIIARGYDLSSDKLKMTYLLGPRMGTALKATTPNNLFIFTEDMGRLGKSPNQPLLIQVRYITSSFSPLLSWNGTVKIADNLPFEMNWDYGPGEAPVDFLRIIGGSKDGKGDVKGEGSWDVKIKLTGVPLAEAYKDAKFSLVQKPASGAQSSRPINGTMDNLNISIDVGSLQDLGGESDYRYAIAGGSIPNQRIVFSEWKSLFVISLPEWLADTKTSQFVNGQYDIDFRLTLDNPLKKAAITIDETGLFTGRSSWATLTLASEVLASPDVRNFVTAKVTELVAQGVFLNTPFEKRLDTKNVAVDITLDKRTLQLQGDLSIVTQPQRIAAITFFNSNNKTLSLKKSIPDLPKIGLLDFKFKADFQAKGTLDISGGIRLKAEGRSLTILGPQGHANSFVNLEANAGARLDAKASLQFVKVLGCSVADLGLEGSVAANLRGVLQFDFSGSIGFADSGITGKLNTSVNRNVSGLALGVAYKLEFQPTYLCGLFKGDKKLLANGLDTWTIFGTNKNIEASINISYKNGDGIFAGIPSATKTLVRKQQWQLRKADDLAHRQSPAKGSLEVQAPIFPWTERIDFDFVALGNEAQLTPNNHFVDVVLRSDSDTVILQSIDLADSQLTVAQNSLGFASARQTVSIPIDNEALDPLFIYTLHFEFFSPGSASNEQVQIQLDKLIVDQAQPSAILTSSELRNGRIDFSNATSQNPVARLRIDNPGRAPLIIAPPELNSSAFQIVNAWQTPISLGADQSVEFEVKLIDVQNAVGGTLVLSTNDPQNSTITIPLIHNGVLLIDNIAPAVQHLSLRSSTWPTSTPDLIPTNNPIRLVQVDQIQIRFSEKVRDPQDALRVAGSKGSIPFSTFAYHESTSIGTWTFDKPFGMDQVVVMLDPLVTDLAGNFVASNATWNLSFRPGDLTGDAIVGLADLQRMHSAIKAGTNQGDVNGDGQTTRSDLVALSSVYGTNGNQLPTFGPRLSLQSVAERSASAGQRLDIQLQGSSLDAGKTFQYQLVSGPAGMTVHSQTGLVSWTPPLGDRSFHSVTVAATSTANPISSARRTFAIHVQSPNTTPGFANVAPWDITQGETFVQFAPAIDSDLPFDRLTFRLEDNPQGMTIDAQTGLVAWETDLMTPARQHAVHIRVTDERGATSVLRTNINVVRREVAPFIEPISPMIALEGSTVTFRMAATDENPTDQVRYRLGSNAPSSATLDPQTGQFTWQHMPNQQTGLYRFEVIATDDSELSLSDRFEVQIEIVEQNSAPIIASVPLQTVAAGTTWQYQLVTNDADIPANELTYRFLSVPDPHVYLSNDTGLIYWDVPQDKSGEFVFEVEVRDNGTPALSSREHVRVTVLPETIPPVVSSRLVNDTGTLGDHITSDVTIAAWIFDVSPISKVFASVNQPNVLSEISVSFFSDGSFEISKEQLKQLYGNELTTGVYHVSIAAEDIFGNRSEATSIRVQYFFSTPKLTVALAPEFDTEPLGDGQTNFRFVDLVGTTDPGNSVTLQGSAISGIANNAGAFRLEGISLSEGYNVLSVEVQDAAGGRAQEFETVFRNPANCLPSDFSGAQACRVQYEFHDISSSGSTILEAADDDAIELSTEFIDGFPIQFYGAQYDRLFVSSNGLITFIEPVPQFASSRDDLTEFPFSPAVAVLWSDLNVPDSPSGIIAEVIGTAPYRQLVIQWNDVEVYEVGGALTFQAVIFETLQAVQLNFQDLTNDELENVAEIATIGIKGDGSQFDLQRVLVSAFEPTEFVDSGTSILFSWTGSNQFPPELQVALENDTLYADSITSDPTLIGQAIDQSGVTHLWMGYADDFEIPAFEDFIDVRIVLLPDGRFRIDETLLQEAVGHELVDQSYLFWLVAGDSEGNLSEPFDISFDLLRNGPIVPPVFTLAAEFDSAPFGDNRTVFERVSLVGQTEESVELVLAGREDEPVHPFFGEFKLDGVTLVPGVNTITVIARDLAGNSISWTEEIIYQPDTCVGPDGFGYQACVVPTSFTDISSTGTRNPFSNALTENDIISLSTTQLAGFRFSFYGVQYSRVYIGYNGILMFGSERPSPWWWVDTLQYQPYEATIAPFAFYLPGFDTEQGNVYWRVLGSGNNQQLVVQWDNLTHASAGESLRFQAVLSEADNSIQFNYQNLNSAVDMAFSEVQVGIKDEGEQTPENNLLYLASGSLTQFVGSQISTRMTIQPFAHKIAAQGLDLREIQFALDDEILLDLAQLRKRGENRSAFVA